MDWVGQSLEAFGRNLGLPEFALDGNGWAALSIDGDALLTFQDLDNEGGSALLVTLHAGLTVSAPTALRTAMRRADFRRSQDWPIQLGLRNQTLLATVRLPRHAVLLPTLEEAMTSLLDLMDGLRDGD